MMTPVLPAAFGAVGARQQAGGFIITLQLLGCVVVPTYIIVPLGGGNITTYFILSTVCFVLAAVVCLIFMKTCGAFDPKELYNEQ